MTKWYERKDLFEKSFQSHSETPTLYEKSINNQINDSRYSKSFETAKNIGMIRDK